MVARLAEESDVQIVQSALSTRVRSPPKDTQRPHSIRIHLQMLDKRTRTFHVKSDPSNPGIKHLERFPFKLDRIHTS